MIKCPKCNGELKVTNTMSEVNKIVRRRKCAVCGMYFFTEEVLKVYGETSEHDSGDEGRESRKEA